MLADCLSKVAGVVCALVEPVSGSVAATDGEASEVETCDVVVSYPGKITGGLCTFSFFSSVVAELPLVLSPSSSSSLLSCLTFA